MTTLPTAGESVPTVGYPGKFPAIRRTILPFIANLALARTAVEALAAEEAVEARLLADRTVPATPRAVVSRLRTYMSGLARKRPVVAAELSEDLRIAAVLLDRHLAFTAHLKTCTRCQRFSFCAEGAVLWAEVQG